MAQAFVSKKMERIQLLRRSNEKSGTPTKAKSETKPQNKPQSHTPSAKPSPAKADANPKNNNNHPNGNLEEIKKPKITPVVSPPGNSKSKDSPKIKSDKRGEKPSTSTTSAALKVKPAPPPKNKEPKTTPPVTSAPSQPQDGQLQPQIKPGVVAKDLTEKPKDDSTPTSTLSLTTTTSSKITEKTPSVIIDTENINQNIGTNVTESAVKKGNNAIKSASRQTKDVETSSTPPPEVKAETKDLPTHSSLNISNTGNGNENNQQSFVSTASTSNEGDNNESSAAALTIKSTDFQKPELNSTQSQDLLKQTTKDQAEQATTSGDTRAQALTTEQPPTDGQNETIKAESSDNDQSTTIQSLSENDTSNNDQGNGSQNLLITQSSQTSSSQSKVTSDQTQSSSGSGSDPKPNDKNDGNSNSPLLLSAGDGLSNGSYKSEPALFISLAFFYVFFV